MHEGSVALGVRLLERHARHEAAAVDARLLGRDAHPDRALAHQVAVQEEAVGGRIDAAAHVHPLHHRGAVEARRILRAEHDDARREGRVRGALGLPAPVFAALAAERVAGGGARQEPFLPHVSRGGSDACCDHEGIAGDGALESCTGGAHVRIS